MTPASSPKTSALGWETPESITRSTKPLERSEKMKKMNRLARAQLLGDLETGLQNPRRICHEAARYRRTLGATPAFAAATSPAPLPLSRTQALGLPQDSHRYSLRPQDRYGLGRPAGRTGLRLRQDLPTLPADLAPSRRLGQVACPVAGRTQRRGPDRLATCLDRRFLRQGAGRGPRHGAQSHGSEQVGQQAPCDDRWPRHSPVRDGDSGQRQRGHGGLRCPDEYAPRRWQAGTQAAETRTAARRSRL